MSRPLKIFMRGSRVTRLQHLLQKRGYEITDAPGLFGTSTRAAVKQFQQDQTLEANGVVNDKVFALLENKAEGDTETTPSKQADSDVANLQVQVDVLTRLLIQKGVITAEELKLLQQGKEIPEPSPTPSSPPGIGKPLF